MTQLKKIAKIGLYTLALLIVLSWLAKVWWIASGSNRWELVIDRDGVQVYSLKTPGHYVTQFKSVMKGPYTVNQMAAALLLDNASLDNCKQWIPTCIGDVVVEPYSDKAQGDSILWTLSLGPFDNREFLIRTYGSQDPQTGVVAIDILAATNKVPRNDCCFRVTRIHNRWQFAPQSAGGVEISLVQDARMAGFFPDFIVNLAGAEQAHKLFHELLPVLVDKAQYRNARFDFIKTTL